MAPDPASPPPGAEAEVILLAGALARPEAERAALLAAACAGNDRLERRVAALLAAHARPAALGELGAETQPLDGGNPRPETDAQDEAVGQMLGRYKLLERLGEGGCGVVYVAEQTEPVRRRDGCDPLPVSARSHGRGALPRRPVRGRHGRRERRPHGHPSLDSARRRRTAAAQGTDIPGRSAT